MIALLGKRMGEKIQQNRSMRRPRSEFPDRETHTISFMEDRQKQTH